MIGEPIIYADLTSCDKEPIHIPGSIQPHGVLLALHAADLRITQISANTRALLGRPPHDFLGQPLSSLLNPAQLESFRSRLVGMELNDNPLYSFTLMVAGVEQPFDVITHRHQDRLIMELEPSTRDDQGTSLRVYRMVKTAVAACQRAPSMREFAQAMVSYVRTLTGFDRVMAYQFQPDGTGVVIAEDLRDDLSSYLDLHYPASDIPQQARALYLRNWLRLIPDVAYRPAPMLAAADDAEQSPLDMSFAALRSVSPIHIEYLHNMGATASLSISLIKNEQLWGLIACHHHAGPRYLPYDVRAACEFLGQMVSLQIAEKEALDDAAYTIALQATQAHLVEHMSTADNVIDGLTRFDPNLRAFIEAGGVAVCLDGQCTTLGATPPEPEIRRLTDWLDEQVQDQVFVTNSLAQHYPAAAIFKDTASGLLAVRLGRSGVDYILWFRPEVIQTVNWGGNPDKPVELTAEGARLSPRRSFEVWKQTVRLTALPWKPCEVAAARDLRRAIIEVVLYKAEELARLNAELARSNVELDSFAYVASHDLKEPLRGLHNYAHFLIEDYGERLDAEGVDKLNTLISLTQRMETLIDSLLHYSRVGRAELAWAETDLNAVLADVIALLGPRIRESGVDVRIPRPLPRVRTDKARVGEVFSNLIANAIKYNDKAEKWVEIGYQPIQPRPGSDEAAQYVFYVRDNGIGIPEQHQETIFRIFKRLHGRDEYGGGVGAGLTIAKKIVERHEGTIWVVSQPGEGATFYFTLAPGDCKL